MTEFVGFVTKIETKQGVSKNNKPYTVYNVTATQKSGEETRIGWGFDAPTFGEGVWIKTQLEQNGQYLNYKKAFVEVAGGPAPAVSSPAAAPSGSSAGTGADRQASIIYQSSRKDALQLVTVLLGADALPISTGKGKAGEAKRYEQILEIVDKMTVQFYHDVDTLRLLESVADAGDVDVKARGEMPEEIEAPAEPETEAGTDDDIPF